VQITQTPWRETRARLSPDEHWIAYDSTQYGTDQEEVWVQAFPGGEKKTRISVSGGVDPSWRKDGKELFYLARDGNLMVLPVNASATQPFGTPTPLFHTTAEGKTGIELHRYAASPDGQRFLVSERDEEQDRITVVVNWTALLRR